MKTSDLIYFSIPNYLGFFDLNLKLIELKETYPKKFIQNIVIDSCYGCFPSCCWGGGRIISQAPFDEQQVIKTLQAFNSKGVSLRHTFTNSLLTENHLTDSNCNRVLQLSNVFSKHYNVSNGCTIYSETLMRYIQQNFENLSLHWSTTKEIQDMSLINDLSMNTNLVLSYTFNNKFDQLQLLKHPEHIEILCVEQGCVDNCPKREEHYKLISKINLGDKNVNKEQLLCLQDLQDKSLPYYSNITSRFHYIDLNTIQTKYLPLGLNHFKISGRGGNPASIINTIENYVNYFVLPEYHDEIRNILLIEFLNQAFRNN